MVRVTVWGENVHERNEPAVRAIYPDGMHAAIAAGLLGICSASRCTCAPRRSTSPSTG